MSSSEEPSLSSSEELSLSSSEQSSSEQTSLPRRPTGFKYIDGPNDEEILVPSYMALDAATVMSMDYKKELLNVDKATTGVQYDFVYNPSVPNV